MDLSNISQKQASLLLARSDSIVARSKPFGEPQPQDAKNEDNQQMRVYLRIKRVPSYNEYSIQNDDTLLYRSSSSDSGINSAHNQYPTDKVFKFTKVFGPDVSQSEIFGEVVKDKLVHFMNGHNCTILTYGASGSGKTYTIIGNSNHPGIIPKSLEYLFRSLPNVSSTPDIKPLPNGEIMHLTSFQQAREKKACQNLLSNMASKKDFNFNEHIRTYKLMQQRLSHDATAVITCDTSDVCVSVWVSFAEIYNENIFDLLMPSLDRSKKLNLGCTNGCSYIDRLTYINVSSALEAYKILQYGIYNVQYASTSINQHSSRSHSIFTIKLVQSSSQRGTAVVSSFNFCDLAGSERSKKTNNIGERLKESNKINASLLVLGRCMSLIRHNQKKKASKIVPFRESKLTRLFQQALAGRESISMIVNITPTTEMYQESLHALNFSAIAKDVILIEQEIIEHACNNKFTEYLNETATLAHENDVEDANISLIEKLEDEYEQLCEQLLQYREDAGEEQKELKARYEGLLSEVREFWKTKYEKLREEFQTVRFASRKSESIIMISSSEDEDEDKEFCDKNKNISVITVDTSIDTSIEGNSKKHPKISETKTKIQSLKVDIEEEEKEIRQLKDRNESLRTTLNEANEACLKLENIYKTRVSNLCTTIFLQNEAINRKCSQIEDTDKNLAHSDAEENDEESNEERYEYEEANENEDSCEEGQFLEVSDTSGTQFLSFTE